MRVTPGRAREGADSADRFVRRTLMAGAGVGSGQDKSVSLSSAHPVDTHALASVLQKSGLSFQGSQAFAQGLLVASVADRKALASLFADALDQLRARRRT
jgi:hypothetical protein